MLHQLAVEKIHERLPKKAPTHSLGCPLCVLRDKNVKHAQSGIFVALLTKTKKFMTFLTKAAHACENEGKTNIFTLQTTC